MYFFHGVPSHSISEKVGLACQASSTAAVVAVAAGVVAVAIAVVVARVVVAVVVARVAVVVVARVVVAVTDIVGVGVVRSPRSMKSLLTMFVTSVLHSL